MKEILKIFKPYKYTFMASIAFMILDVMGEIVQPILMSTIVGNGISTGNLTTIIISGALMFVFALIAIIGGVGNSRFSAKTGVYFATNLRRQLFKKVQTFSFNNIDFFSTASLSTRLTNDITLIQNTTIMTLRILVRAPLMLVFAIFMAVRLNPSLALILAVISPVLIIVLAFIVSKAMPKFILMQKKIDKLNTNVQENLTNVRVVKSFVREDYEKNKFEKSNSDLMDTALAAMNIVIFNMPVMMLAMNTAILCVIYFGGRQVINGSLDVATMSAFINYIFMILMSLMMLTMIFVMLSRTSASFKRTIEILRTDIDLTDIPHAKHLNNVKGEIEFKNVCFKYSDENTENILTDINFKANPGEVIAIVGGTGSGKSSLVQLIPRLYDVTSGEILIDGVNIKNYTLESLRNNIGMVLQKNTLFSGTIKENLKWGNLNASDEEVVEASKAAQAHDFIMGFKDNYDTWIEQGGVNVSGGQKQRLCIARAMLKKPAVLILDDSTSAVDTATESKIRESFYTTLKNTTTFLIAQRISSVEGADKIIVLDNGSIAGIGTHKELLKSCSQYQEIYSSQKNKEADN